ncbi:unnamed protein product [Haemonchus placei]|uniref:Ig-like domain-containing protein n=1 Tax=Haemonchus placei TaxID=6290 RepID=A0A0N4VXV7_HAEPC|nr:unnamed protein product [Haemonchus placei]
MLPIIDSIDLEVFPFSSTLRRLYVFSYSFVLHCGKCPYFGFAMILIEFYDINTNGHYCETLRPHHSYITIIMQCSEPVNQTTLVIRLGPNDQLYAHKAQTYLLKLFNGSVSNIHCNFNVIPLCSFQLSNSSLSDDYDVIIRSFDASLHSGNYSCYGTFMNGNETEIEEVSIQAYDYFLLQRSGHFSFTTFAFREA